MISVLITSGSRYPFGRRAVRQKTKSFLKKSGLDDVEISLYVVGARKSQTLNKQYRALDEPASVLSFPLDEPRGPDDILRLGDIVVCYPMARKQAALEKKMVDEVVWELVEHGLRNLISK